MAMAWRYLDPELVERLNHMELSARRVVEGATIGLHKSPMKGASVEFRQHRFYAPGDEPRRLDWRVLARTDRPYIKEYDEETNLRSVIMLDSSGSMGYGRQNGRKFDAAARIAAALAYVMLRHSESVGLATFADAVAGYLPPHSLTSQLSRLIDQLERTDPQGACDFPNAVQSIADRLGRRALIILISDFFSPLKSIREGFARLNYERHETVAIQVIDPDEQEFPFVNWCRFRGLEGEGPALAEPAIARKQYLDNFNRHQADLLEACRSMRIEYHRYRTDQSLPDWLLQMLSRRA